MQEWAEPVAMVEALSRNPRKPDSCFRRNDINEGRRKGNRESLQRTQAPPRSRTPSAMTILRTLFTPIIALFVLISGVAAPSHAQQQGSFQLIPGVKCLFGMESGYAWLTGEFLIPAGGQPGSGATVHISEDLGLDQAEVTSASFQTVILDAHRINIDRVMFTPSAERRIHRTLVFHNKTYETGTTVESKIDFTWTRGGYGYALKEWGGFYIGPRVGVHYIHNRISLNAETKEAGLLANSRALDATFPVLGFDVRRELLPGFGAFLDVEGIHLVTRGFLAMGRFSLALEPHPDIVWTGGVWARWAHFLEDNQPVNNEWRMAGLCFWTGLSFSF
jgi:hypothetical protein